MKTIREQNNLFSFLLNFYLKLQQVNQNNANFDILNYIFII